MNSHNQLRRVVFTGLFAAIIFIGISALRIPIPALVGRPFVHFGNPLMILAIIVLGPWYGFAAGAIGLGGFDLLNGYASTAWLTVAEVAVMALVVTTLLKLTRGDDRPRNIITIALLAGFTKLCTTYVVSVIEGTLYESLAFNVAAVKSFFSLQATLINSIATAIIVPALYFALRASFKRLKLK